MDRLEDMYGRQAISIDCVVFGFDGESLKVLLTRRRRLPAAYSDQDSVRDYKLPGSLIANNEDLDSAVNRVMEELTGMRKIFLRQMAVFSDPNRVVGDELRWLNEYYNVSTKRVVTVAYYSLVKLTETLVSYTTKQQAKWVDLHDVKRLALDHSTILVSALDHLTARFLKEPVAFELLPKKFTIRQLQKLYTTVLNIEVDSRNFRKKLLATGYLIPTGDKESGVAHKPAEYYTFDHRVYDREAKRKFKLNLINWHFQ